MDQATAGQLAVDLQRVHVALHFALKAIEGVDQTRAALRLVEPDEAQYSALRTSLAQAQKTIAAVQTTLREAAGPRRRRRT